MNLFRLAATVILFGLLLLFSPVVPVTHGYEIEQQPSSSSSSFCRDRFLWPFAATSIWNTPIGDRAEFKKINLYPSSDIRNEFGPPMNFHIDQDWAIDSRHKNEKSFVVNASWYDDAGAFPAPACGAQPDRCCTIQKDKLKVRAQIPLPEDLETDCEPNNNAAAVLLPDNRTLVQMQPFYRRGNFAGGGGSALPFLSWYHRGAPQKFPWEMDILGDGAQGAHGGSGLSALGGSIRLGELSSSSSSSANKKIRHALKLELWSHPYYYGQRPALQNKSSYNQGRNQYLWPATGSDSGSEVPCEQKGGLYCGTDPHVAPGALLAVPPSVASQVRQQLKTIVAQKLLQALTDFGGYIVDDTGSQAGGAAFCAEPAVIDELWREYGISLNITNSVRPNSGGVNGALYEDLLLV